MKQLLEELTKLYLIENERIHCEKPLQALSICGKIRVTEIRKGNQL